MAQQWPPVGEEDLYFGGTAFKNIYGLGVQVAPGAEREAAFAAESKVSGEFPQSEWVLIPVSELYDHGRMVTESEVLRPRLAERVLRVSQDSMEKLGVEPGQDVEVHLNGDVHVMPVKVEGSLPDGVVLVGRSQGVPVSVPAAVEIKAVS